jgi:hypothetical protein
MNNEERQRLISAWIDGQLDEADFATLQHELEASEDARQDLRDWVSADLALNELAAARSMVSPLEQPSIDKRVHSTQRSRVWQRIHSLGWLAAAASIIFVSLAVLRRDSNSESTPIEASSQICATLDNLSGPFSSNNASRSLVAGKYNVESGVTRLNFLCGANVVMDGPAQYEVISAWEMRLLSGRLRAHVPEVAQGFIVHGPELRVKDLGTEFAMNVNAESKQCSIRVFDGEVVADSKGESVNVLAGNELVKELPGTMQLVSTTTQYLDIDAATTQANESKSRFNAWRQWQSDIDQESNVALHFHPSNASGHNWIPRISNSAAAKPNDSDAIAIGIRKTEGRWSDNVAWEFKRPGDRVRFQINESFNELTFACWAKVDSLDKHYSALFLTDGYESGEPHWQFLEDGRLLFSIIYLPPEFSNLRGGKLSQDFITPVVISPEKLGEWRHFAVTYHNATGIVNQYVDGKLVFTDKSDLFQANRPVRFGSCEIGNWGVPLTGHPFPIRNFNGSLDEFLIFRTALTAEEIAELYDVGKPLQ